jgi:hypothetical protein
VLVALTLAGSLGAAATTGPAAAVPEVAATAQRSTAAELAGRVAHLTVADRAPGAPAPGSVAENQFADATVDIDLLAGNVYVDAHLAAPPTVGYFDRPTFQVEPGTWDGTRCVRIPGSEVIGDNFTASGEAVEYTQTLPAGWESASCVVAFSFADVQNRLAYDVLHGALTDRFVSPDLSVGAPELLGSTKVGLVRGVWTPLDVPVSNAGEGTAHVVTVTGKGKGVKVRRTTITDLSWYGSPQDPGTKTARLMVKLTDKARRARLSVLASADGVTAKRTVRVRRVSAPTAPKPGTYRGSDVSFTVKGGKAPQIKRFRIRTKTECTSSPYDTMNTYSFPTTKISKAGIVSGTDEQEGDAGFTVGLEMLVAGGTATKGSFWYSGPAGCSARASFKARRTAR